jgi:hypothetical protein
LDLVQFLLVLAVVAAVVAVVTGPLRREPAPGPEPDRELPALEAAKEAKYREIRDAEMDRRTGKLSEADWSALDAQLRAEAMEILRRIDEAGAP